jgi:hypothetical protein
MSQALPIAFEYSLNPLPLHSHHLMEIDTHQEIPPPSKPMHANLRKKGKKRSNTAGISALEVSINPNSTMALCGMQLVTQ